MKRGLWERGRAERVILGQEELRENKDDYHDIISVTHKGRNRKGERVQDRNTVSESR